ncbi:hypothetical protein JCM19992_06320 [Thermostilla marina]
MGRPKHRLPLGAGTLLDHMVRLVSAEADQTAVVAAADDPGPFPDDVCLLRDREDYAGPLAALAVALDAFPGCSGVLLTACDLPLLRRELVALLWETAAAHPEVAAIVPKPDKYPEPLAAIYRPHLTAVVRRLLASGERRLYRVFDEVPVHYLAADELRRVDPLLESFRNMNTPDEYRAIRERLERT